MELRLGYEPQNSYLKYELFKGAMAMVGNHMMAQPGETVLITADSSSDMRVADALGAAAYTLGCTPVVIEYPTAKETCIDPPLPIQAAACAADIWIEIADKNVQHTQSWQKAIASGVRYICLTGLDVDMIVRCVANVDIDLIVELGELIKDIMENSNEIIITSESGTNLRAEMQGRRVRHSGRKASVKGYPNMLPGQISWCPIESTINGRLVFDGALWPPANIAKLNSPIYLDLKDGVVVNVEGGAEADIFRDWLASYNDPNCYRLAHYSLGFNPGVLAPTGRIVEDERVFGGAEFGIGSQGAAIMGEKWDAPSHTDGTLLKPTILLDGKVFEENGIYKDERVIEICRKMNIAGY